LVRELEKVDERFFDVHDTSEEQVDELDSTVPPLTDPTDISGIMALPRKSRKNGRSLVHN
jgi:hypothetical protein